MGKNLRTGRFAAAIGIAALAIGLLATNANAHATITKPSARPAAAASAQHQLVTIHRNAAAGNYCNLPTSAGAGSGYHRSFSDCLQCVQAAANAQVSVFDGFPIWYCTYNPSNGLTDAHFSANTSGTCDLPQSAGPGSSFFEFYTDCYKCTHDATTGVLNTHVHPFVFYCTYNPSNGHTDDHTGD